MTLVQVHFASLNASGFGVAALCDGSLPPSLSRVLDPLETAVSHGSFSLSPALRR